MAKNNFSEALRLRELQKEARRRIAAGALMIVGGIAAEGSSSAAAYTGAIGGVTAIETGVEQKSSSNKSRTSITRAKRSACK